MFIDYSFFNGNFFDGNISIGEINRLDIQNIVLDEVKIDRNSNTTYDSEKQNWGYNTILQGKFQDSGFELGNVRLNGMPVEYLRVKKKRDGEITWNKYIDIPFDSDQTNYSWTDYFCQSLTEYSYAIVPIGASGVEGEYGIQSIDCEYEDLFILGSDGTQYKLQANINLSDIANNSESSYITTLGSRYPIEIRNGTINYKKTSVKAMLVSDSTLNGYGTIDRKAENELRENIYNFLINGKPKILKESSGLYILVSIQPSSVKLTPNNDLSRGIAEISFDVVEIGDVFNTEILRNSSLLS